MHAHLYSCLNGNGAFHIVNMDHAFVAIGFAFCASHFTGFAANATLHVYEKLHICFKGGYFHGVDVFIVNQILSNAAISPGWVNTPNGSSLQAHTLNSGILDTGSSVPMVSWLADFLPGQ